MKAFNEVKPDDVGKDYGDEPGTVIATGTYQELKQYDSTGACDFMEDGEGEQMVAVRDAEGESILYVYGEDGFSVEEAK